MNPVSGDPVVTNLACSPASAAPRGRRGFWALIATQFQGAFSDNILRNLLLSIVIGMNMAQTQRETFVSVVTFLFSVPFLILSMPGGWLADHFSKRQITIWTKVMEFGSMLLATAGLATHTLALSLVALTLVASQAALFGPSKYGLLPELLPEKSLSWGNGVIELCTFLAIIIGHRGRRVDGRALRRARSDMRATCCWVSRRSASSPASASTKCPPRRRKNPSA